MSATGDRIHVIGGGVAGLVAAITVAEAGAPVVLHEAGRHLGGRGRSGAGPGSSRTFGLNTGPHVLFADGAVLQWLRAQRIALSVRRPSAIGGAMIRDGRARQVPALGFVARGLLHLRAEAPVDERFDAWATRVLGEADAQEMARWAGLLTFHHDPGSLSARFVWDRCRRVFARPDHVRAVTGGWSSLIDVLAVRARARGVTIETGMRSSALPEGGPVIVATGLPAASRLLGQGLSWAGSRTALLDVALAPRPSSRRPPLAVDLSADLRTCCFIDRVTAADPTLAPPGIDLLQAQLGIDSTVPDDDATRRMEAALDLGFPGWREDETWRRAQVRTDATGAVDLPGTSWRDRPAIDRGDDRFLAGDMAAAPGLLSEVAVNSAVRAAQLALDARRQRAFAPGWPTASLTPTARVELVAASMPVAVTRSVVAAAPLDETWQGEPSAEVEPYFQLRTGRLHTVAVGAAAGTAGGAAAGATTVAVAVGTRFSTSRPVRWLLELVARRELRRHRPR
jgi:phytoene dehydrogenase-like protein